MDTELPSSSPSILDDARLRHRLHSLLDMTIRELGEGLHGGRVEGAVGGRAGVAVLVDMISELAGALLSSINVGEGEVLDLLGEDRSRVS